MKANVSIDTRSLGGGRIQVYGTVISETGGGVPNAVVEIHSNRIGLLIITTANDNGYYSVVLMLTGDHKLRARLVGGVVLMATYEEAISPPADVSAGKWKASLNAFFTAPTKFDGSITRGDTVSWKVTLTDTLTGVGLPGRSIKAARAVYEAIDTTIDYSYGTSIIIVTDSAGIASFIEQLSTSTDKYRRRFIFEGDADYDYVKIDNIDYRTEKRSPTLTLELDVAVATMGDPLTWKGLLADPKVPTYGVPEKNVYLDQKTSATTVWSLGVSGPVKTGSDGRYQGTYTLPITPGVYQYRSRFPGGSAGIQHELSVSDTVTVEVKEELTAWDELKNRWNALPVWSKGLIIVTPIGAVVLATRKKKK